MHPQALEQARDLACVEGKLASQVGVAQPMDVVLPAQEALEDSLVLRKEEVEALVPPVAVELGVADLAEELVASGGARRWPK